MHSNTQIFKINLRAFSIKICRAKDTFISNEPLLDDSWRIKLEHFKQNQFKNFILVERGTYTSPFIKMRRCISGLDEMGGCPERVVEDREAAGRAE